MDYEEGQRVEFNLKDELETSGIGIIRGIATIGGPIIGKGYIVQILAIDPSLTTYKYSCIQVFELFLKPLGPM